MAVVTIPFDYDQLEDPSSVVPICIDDTDRDGRRIAWGWFTATVPIANSLRKLAHLRLGDVWRVSELAECTVHNVWYKHGENLGLWPSKKLWHYAKWKAEDIRAGGWRLRHRVDEPLPEDENKLERIIEKADPTALAVLLPEGKWNFANELERAQFFDVLIRKMQMRGDVRASEILAMLCHGMDRAEINALFEERPNTLAQNLFRSLKRSLKDMGLV